MSLNPISQRFPFETQLQGESEGVRAAHRYAFSGIVDLNQALASLKTQVDAVKAQGSATGASVAASTATVSASSASALASGSVSPATSSATAAAVSDCDCPPLGGVNNQTGTAYTLLPTDNGSIVTLNNGSAVTVRLNSGVSAGFFGALENIGAGTVTATPSTGTVNGAASITLATNQGSFLFFDGVNWWAVTSATSGGGGSPIKNTLSLGTGTLAAQAYTTIAVPAVTGASATSVITATLSIPPSATPPSTPGTPAFVGVTPWWNGSSFQVQIFNSSTSSVWTYTGFSLLVSVWV